MHDVKLIATRTRGLGEIWIIEFINLVASQVYWCHYRQPQGLGTPLSCSAQSGVCPPVTSTLVLRIQVFIICNIIWHLWFPTQTADHTTVKPSILSSMLKFTSPPISHVSQSLKRLINGLAGTETELLWSHRLSAQSFKMFPCFPTALIASISLSCGAVNADCYRINTGKAGERDGGED